MRAFLLAALVAVMTLTLPLARAADPAPDVVKAPAFILPDLAENPHSLEEYRKQGPVMLVFYATWCPTCLSEIPNLKRIYRTYRETGLQMVAINVGLMDTLENAKTYALRHRLPYPVLYDAEAGVAKSYGVKSFPRIFLIHENGSVFAETVRITDEQITDFLKSVNKEPQAP